jgi:hypothetical protein
VNLCFMKTSLLIACPRFSRLAVNPLESNAFAFISGVVPRQTTIVRSLRITRKTDSQRSGILGDPDLRITTVAPST